MDLKLHRDNENKIHELLYNNLYLLSQFYPTSTEFNAIFKMDMFMRTNKSAFFEVVYYLLSILSPEQVNQKLTMWPPYDIKRENKFRTEVLNYVNELNVLYEYAHIPPIMQSHLISPGGFKFTKFMLKLSELVVFEHLKKYNKADLYCPVPNDNFDFHIAYFKKQTTLINFKIKVQSEKFNGFYNEGKTKAQQTFHDLTDIDKVIVEEKKKNLRTQEQFKKEYPLYPSVETLNEKVKCLYEEWSSLQPIHELFRLCGSLLKYISSNSIVLEHKKDQLKVPNEIIHIIKNREELDLIEFFQGLNVLIEHRALDLPSISNTFMNLNIQKINNLKLKYMDLIITFNERKQNIQTASKKLLEGVKLLEDSRYEMQTTVLVPLIHVNTLTC